MLSLGSSNMLMGKMLSCTAYQAQYGQSSCTLGNVFVRAHHRRRIASKSTPPSCSQTVLALIFHGVNAGV